MKNLKTFAVIIVIAAQFLWSINGYANPTGGNVAAGSATFDGTSTPGTLNVNQASNQAIINWQTFSINPGETTRFNQPGASSVALNRVLGGSPSDIFGTLSANGHVFLINQNGILFAPGSQVNVGGLIASTMDISDSNFLSGQYQHRDAQGNLVNVNGYRFIGHGNFGSVINHGNININAPGGYAALLGSNVENTGMITANTGTVALASGRAVTVDLDPSGNVSAVVAHPGRTAFSSPGVSNSGTIHANGGTVILTAHSLQGIFSNLVNNTGVIEANAVNVNSNGNVSLSGGSITAGQGGVAITGNGVNIDTTQITSSATGGLASVAINYNNGLTINNSQITADSSDIPGLTPVITHNAQVNITGKGVAHITNSQIESHVGSLAINPPVTIAGTEVNINSSLDSNGKSGVILDGSTVSSDTTGVTASVYNNVSAQVNPNDASTGNVQLLHGSSINARQANETGFESVAVSGQNITGDATSSINGDNILTLTAAGGIGSSTQALNINVPRLNANSGTDMYLNAGSYIFLNNVHADKGKISVVADGQIDAFNVTTDLGDISLETTFGDIEVGNVNAGGGASDVTLDAAGNIYRGNASSVITANNLNMTTGINGSSVGQQLFLGTDISTSVVNGHQVLVLKNQPGAATYDIYFRAGILSTGPYQLVASGVQASFASTTTWTDPSASVVSGSYYAVVASAQTSNIGTSTERLNTNVNTISALSQDKGDIYLNQGNAVTLKNVRTQNGLIDIIANGQINAQNVMSLGLPGNSGISLKTTFGDIDVGNINANGGTDDVSLDSAGNIYSNDANSLITANNLNMSAGINGTSVGQQLILGRDIQTYVNGQGNQVLVIHNQPGAATYDIYFRAGILSTGPYQKIAAGVGASDGASTIWTDPAQATGSGSYYAVVATPQTSNIGSSGNPINTKVNTTSAVTKDVGDIYLNQTKSGTLSNITVPHGLVNIIAVGDTTVGNINASGDVFLTSGGSILGTAGGTNITSGGDTHLDAGDVIGSWDPYAPLTVDVGGDLYMSIANSSGSATGTVGPLAVSGTLEGNVNGDYHFIPGSFNITSNGAFIGNPPGYVFFNHDEIWPNLGIVTPPGGASPALTNTDNLATQVSNAIQPNQSVYYEKQHRHLVRPVEVAAPLAVYAYHATLNNNISALNNVKLEPEAYDYIDSRINLSNHTSTSKNNDNKVQ